MLDESLIGPSVEQQLNKNAIKHAFFHKKAKDKINRPRLPNKEKNANGIMNRLKEGNAIIGWYCLLGSIDSFYAYQLDNGIIHKFKLGYDHEGIVLIPLEARLFNEDTIIDLWDEEWSHFSRLYVDDLNLYGQRMYVTDVSDEEIKNTIHDLQVFVITENRILKKPASDGNR